MHKKGRLTNEHLNKKFCDNFKLAEHMIGVAQHKIKKGEDIHVYSLMESFSKTAALPDQKND